MQARLGTAFVRTASAYLATIGPLVGAELAHWRSSAAAVPDPVLRGHALAALNKRGNMHGAALFAIFAPRGCRARAVRALVAFQSAYNYLDMLAEQPSEDPLGNGRLLHEALLAAVDMQTDRNDPYALQSHRDDGGYLREMVDTCWHSASGLASYELVRSPLRAATQRIVDFQSLNLGEQQGSIEGLRRWAEQIATPGSRLAWWETAAAGGSSLGVHALLGLAGDPGLQQRSVSAVEYAYFPWIGGLHSLLDSTVDVLEDARDGQRNLLSHYPTCAVAAAGLERLAVSACSAAATLSDDARHQVILAAMVGYYLSAPEAETSQARAITGGVKDAIGPLAGPAVMLTGLMRRASRVLAEA